MEKSPLNIGVMLRHYEQHEGGVKVYTRNLLSHLLPMDPENRYVLMYQNPRLIGTYSSYPNVKEVAVAFPKNVLWDQFVVPRIERREKLDVVFNPKFTIPFLSRAKTVFVLHGSDWYVMPEASPWHDRLYFRKFAPLYCRHADAVISVSNSVKNDNVRYTGVDPRKIYPIHHGYDADLFRVITDESVLANVREKYHLPDRYILWVGQFYPPKNLGRLLQAISGIKGEIPHKLVIAGEMRWKVKEELALVRELGLAERVHFTGWVAHEDLPVLYNLADLFVFPSLSEGFGIPLVEAMACGCPIVTSNISCPPEVVEGAGYLVDPYDARDIAKGIKTVIFDTVLRKSLIEKGIARAKSFSWVKCAREVMEVLHNVGRTTSPSETTGG